MESIYHGTTQKDLQVIKPFKRYTPGGENVAGSIPPRIYATYNPAYAVAHSFPWPSDDGVDIVTEDNIVTVVVPKNKKRVLEQSVCIYTLPDDIFTYTKEEEMGLTYHSTQEIVPIDCQCFDSVTAAMEHFGGTINYYDWLKNYFLTLRRRPNENWIYSTLQVNNFSFRAKLAH